MEKRYIIELISKYRENTTNEEMYYLYEKMLKKEPYVLCDSIKFSLNSIDRFSNHYKINYEFIYNKSISFVELEFITKKFDFINHVNSILLSIQESDTLDKISLTQLFTYREIKD